MSALLSLLLRIGAGIGLGELLDKLFPDKVPVPVPFKGEPDRLLKLAKWAAFLVACIWAVKTLSSKLGIKILK